MFSRAVTVVVMNISSALPGITRDAIIKQAKNLSIEVREQVLSRESRSLSDVVFMSGTAAESSRYAVPRVLRLAKVASARSMYSASILWPLHR
jgi:hypothetical protein